MKRILKYIRKTRQLGIILRPGEGNKINVYVDASFGIHADGKSHTGVVIGYGAGPVFASSKKQGIVTKSSTESELVGVTDAAGAMELMRQTLEQLGENPEIQVFQDNQSAIKLINNGGSTSLRTRHIKVRYFFLKEYIENGYVKLVYLPTGDMIADVLTKPKQGADFIKSRNQLLNWSYAANTLPTEVEH